MRITLVNAGPLIALAKLNRLHLLVELFETFHVPRSVYREVVVEGLARGLPDAATLRRFFAHHELPVLGVAPAVAEEYRPPVELDAGEHELLALARTFPDVLVLMDDEVARAEARRLGLEVRGTLGILVEAFRAELLSLHEVELLLLEIAERPDIWISEKICRQVLLALQKS